MKTLMTLFAMMTLMVNTHAHTPQPTYVTTQTDTLFCTKAYVGPYKTKCWLFNGEKVVLRTSNVMSYSNSDKTMVKIPVYHKNTKKSFLRMTELVYNNNGIKIYKYVYFNAINDSNDAMFLFYDGEKCINTQTNPSFAQITNYLAEYETNKGVLLTSE